MFGKGRTMKTKVIALIALAGLFSTGTAISAESESTDAQGFIGVLLDSAPLPELLTKHLGLSSGQGIRIRNVQRHSPADEAGLERDDIIIGFEDDEVDDNERFVNAVREAGVGAEVSLQIIHLGKRKTVEIKLRAFDGEFDWKYPREPEAVQSWRPGRLFRLRPGDEDWTEILRDHIPPDIDVDIKKFFNELHTYHHTNGDSYTITIEGSPDDEDSTITVRIDDDEYATTIKEIDKLPEKYRKVAEDAVENARKTSKTRRFDRRIKALTWRPPPDWKNYFDKLHPRNYAPAPPFGRGNEIFDKIQKQMRELRQRLEELEERHGEILDRFSPKRDEKDSKEPDESAPPEDKDEQRV
ncbi:MAG: hypothetical protein CEE38_03980 [Planctomycetes bacterium B3_Pla]|nr:MAG: hypothetical protein CEE38_03980 [Planctomycetes bacterium B3_Pla]